MSSQISHLHTAWHKDSCKDVGILVARFAVNAVNAGGRPPATSADCAALSHGDTIRKVRHGVQVQCVQEVLISQLKPGGKCSWEACAHISTALSRWCKAGL